jgi:D-hydroxyproline dehydrogenase subunit beta
MRSFPHGDRVSAAADVLIIGAGIVGAACADALSAEGMRVTVVDDGRSSATAAGMGHIVVMDDSEAQLALTRYSRDLWDEIAPELPREVEFERRGTLWVAADEEDLAALREKQQRHHAAGVAAEALSPSSLQEAEPNLRGGLAGGLLMPDDSVIYAPCATEWMLDRARGRGASVLLGRKVSGIAPQGVVLEDGSRVAAGATICAAGTWAPELFPGISVRPRKGHLAITDRYPGFLRHQVVELGYLKSVQGGAGESVAFNVQPRATGQILIGSSRQYDSESSGVEAPVLQKMLRRAIGYMPGLAQLPVIRTWTGFRASTEDKLPLIGPCPGRENVYLATGHEGLGITTSLATAKLLAALILDRAPAVPAAPYLPARLSMLPQPAHAGTH